MCGIFNTLGIILYRDSNSASFQYTRVRVREVMNDGWLERVGWKAHASGVGGHGSPNDGRTDIIMT